MQAVAAPICTSGNIFLSITGRTIQFSLIGLGKALLEMQSSDHVQMLSAISSPPVRCHLAVQPEHAPMLLVGGNTAMLDTRFLCGSTLPAYWQSVKDQFRNWSQNSSVQAPTAGLGS